MPPTKIELPGAVVAITGAARGIGRSTAELFLERGARVCLADLDGDHRSRVRRQLLGPVNGMRLVLGMIERGRGHIVNVASMLGRTELPGLASYTTSKHAMVGLTAAVRSELGGTGVTLTVVLPSVVNTELASGITIPLARLARVEAQDVAEAIVASCDSRAKELAVPRWMALSAVDTSGRAAYVERLAKQLVDS